MASTIKVDKIAQASGTPEFTIPTADGTAGQFIKTDASGVLSFGSAPSITGSTNTWIPTITGANALTGTANFTYDGNILDVKNSGTASSIKLYCESSNAHYQAIKAAPHAGSSDWTLTLPGAVPTASGQALTATTAGVASWSNVGITDCSQWRLDTTYTNSSSSDVFFTANLAENSGRLGSAMAESSGVFTFPSTGYWMLEASVTFIDDVSQSHMITKIFTTTNDSTYAVSATSSQSYQSTGTKYASAYTNYLFDVTSVSTHKVKMGFKTVGVAGGQIEGSGSNNCTFFGFTRLGDT